MIPLNDLSRSEDFDEIFLKDLKSIIRSGHFLNGPYTHELENCIKVHTEKKFAFGVANGTAALTLALKSLNLPFGSKIMLSANAGGYARIAINNSGLTPVYVDVNSQGLIDVDKLEKILISQAKISAIIVTHLYGQIAEISKIMQIVNKFDTYVIEDCAQSIGASIQDGFAGKFGSISTFSFYPTKNLGSIGDAGAIATSDKLLADRIGSLKQYGWNEKYHVSISQGDNLRIDEIQALAIVHRFNKISSKNIIRKSIWKRYVDSIGNSPLRLIGSEDNSFVAHLAILDCAGKRSEIQKIFYENEIETAIHYPIPDHRQDAWRDNNLSLPETERQARDFLTLPLFPELNANEIYHICNTLRICGEIW